MDHYPLDVPDWHAQNASFFSMGSFKGNTYTYTYAAPAPAGKDHDTEDDMLRKGFTFPYTGTEIAAALEARAAKLEAASLIELDEATLNVLFPTEFTRADMVMQCSDRQKRAKASAAELRTEAHPYAKAGSKEFDLDADDVDHFGLNVESPAPAVKVKRAYTRKVKPTADVASE